MVSKLRLIAVPVKLKRVMSACHVSPLVRHNRASIMNKFLCSRMCLTSGDTWHADITHLSLTGTAISLSFLTMAVRGF